MIWIDFETRNECDLKTAGVYNYARHPSAQILCMSYARDDDNVATATRLDDMRRILTEKKGEQIRAHNATFERSDPLAQRSV